jgi:subtilisin family serine protease
VTEYQVGPEAELATSAPPESLHIQQQLRSTGVAQVIVVMNAPSQAAAVDPDLSDLLARFTRSPLSQTSALLGASFAGTPSARAARPSREERSPSRTYPNLGIMLGTVDSAGLAALRQDSRVARVTGAPHLSLIRPELIGTGRPSDQPTWGAKALHVDELWAQGLSGSGVRVAHLDTGVDGRHPALRTAVGAFAEFDFLGDLRPGAEAHDSAYHGTHTAATIAGRPVAGKRVGVAHGAELASALVIEGGEIMARVLAGLEWALTQGVKVLSMSLGIRGWWEEFIPVVQILRQRGVLPVIASGNEGPGTSRSPGNYAEALSVGACDQQLRVAGFSSSQRFSRPRDPIVPDLVAPGVEVVSAKPGGGYQVLSGTSMATPHVAGLAALLFEAKPDASVDEVERAVFASCATQDGQSQDRIGRGVPDARAAYQALTGTSLRAPRPAAAKTSSRGRRTGATARKASKVAPKLAARRKARPVRGKKRRPAPKGR